MVEDDTEVVVELVVPFKNEKLAEEEEAMKGEAELEFEAELVDKKFGKEGAVEAEVENEEEDPKNGDE